MLRTPSNHLTIYAYLFDSLAIMSLVKYVDWLSHKLLNLF